MQMAESEDVEFTAQVVDLSCKVVYDLSGAEHRECSQVCADRGVPPRVVGGGRNPVLAGEPGDAGRQRERDPPRPRGAHRDGQGQGH